MAVITISRQYGSKGDEIARRVTDILGYRYFNKQLLAEVASEVGLSPAELLDFSDEKYKVRSFLDRLRNRSRALSEIDSWSESQLSEENHWMRDLNEEQCVTLTRMAIQAAYKHGNVVVVGRGGQVSLKDYPDVLHVRIEATLGTRVMRVKSKQNISVGEAERLTCARDRASSAYLNRFYKIDWTNPLLYHLVINTSKWDIEAASRIIVNAVSNLGHST
ncbi:MAG TPA: cytidylate kinase-like family protein [Thermoflexia bacterium]|nr:cytidylate kinase-like family protein [Thermoflexia bacterium]